MTERFMIDDAGTLIDMQTRNTYDYVSDVCGLLNELSEENEQSKMMIATLRNIILENEDLEKENRELNNRLNKYIVDYNGLNCEWHWLKTENEQIKKDLKIMLPLILAIDFKMSINECKAVNRLCKLVEDDFIKSKELNKVVEKKEYPKRKPITYESVPEAIYNWDDKND